MNLESRKKVRIHLDEAETALAAGLIDRAMHHVREVLHIDPGHAPARLVQARISLMHNDPRQAMEALNAHDLYNPEEREIPSTALLRAETLIRYNLSDLARKLLDRLTSEFPDDVRPHRMRAGLMVQLGDHQSAIESLNNIIRLEPSDSAARSMLSRLLAQQSPQASINLLAHDEAHDPTVQLELARLYQQLDRLSDAEQTLKHLLREQQQDADLWLQAAKLADQMGHDELAVQRATQAVKLGGKREALKTLALIHMNAGRLATAGRIWWRMVQLHREDVQAWSGLMVCGLAVNRAEIVRRARRVLDVHTSRNERRQWLAQLWHHAAIGLTLQRAKSAPAVELTELSPLQRLLYDASQTLHDHARQFPRRADAHYHLAVCHELQGETDAAVDHAQVALKLNPNYTAASRLFDDLTSPSEDPRAAA